MLRSSKPCKAGQKLHLPNGVEAFVEERLADQEWLLRFPFIDVISWLERAGSMPIPPYLNRGADSQDQERYQTVYARESGAVAAPTAGLHFTTELLERLRAKNVSMTTVTLHVGLGTFQPVRTEFVADHRIHRERFTVSVETVDAIARTKQAGGRVVAVGTTSCRTLEYLASQRDGLRAADGEADIFIYPGYQFKVVDMLLTNFHLPESTLIMLVSAFAGHDLTLRAYQEAISARFLIVWCGDCPVQFTG
jgi:S-adenosylmethionine:tRNA ribosyltransferase-isomerase